MMLVCCCSKTRKEEDVTIDGSESKIKNVNRILLEFVNEESKIGMKETPCIEMIEKVLLASNKGEVPKKDIIQIYKSTDTVNQNCIKNFLIQDFFFIDNTRQRYDFNKIVLFNLLYSGGKEVEKANFLFNVLENTSSSAVHNHSQKLLNTLESITYISCIVVGEIINSTRRFKSEMEDSEFQELLSLYSTNANMLREFSNHIASIYLFPSSDEKQYLMRQDFLKKMDDCVYLLIKPHEIRKKYTEYVWQNKARALLPSRALRKTNNFTFKEYSEDAKYQQSDMSESERQSMSLRVVNQQRGKNNNNNNNTLNNSMQATNKKSQRQVAENNLINQMKQQQRYEKIEKFQPPIQSPHTEYSYGTNKNKQKNNLNQANNYGNELNKSASDISMAIYRYEDKSVRGSNTHSPKILDNSKFQVTQKLKPQFATTAKSNSKKWENKNIGSGDYGQIENIISPSISSPKIGRFNDNPFEFQEKGNEKQNSKLTLNMIRSSDRGTQETQATLLSTINLKKYQNVQVYLKEMFGDQFVNFIQYIQSPFDSKRAANLQKSLAALRSMNKLEFPDYTSYPYNVREIFEYFNAIIHKEDLLEFSKGRLFRENIVNVYLKILEKVSMIRQSQYNFSRATMRNSIDLYSQQSQVPQKILYFNTNFFRKLSNENQIKDCLGQLQNFFKYDLVVMPFFIDEEEDQRALLVSIKVANCQVDLYDRERETDNHDISDTVLHLLDLASKIQEVDFSEDQIDGGVEGVMVDKEEDMIVSMCYVAECLTFNKQIDLDNFNVSQERQRILDVFLGLLQFQ